MAFETDELFEMSPEAEKVLDECSKYNTTFHNHTDASLGDGITSPQQLAHRAKEMGASMIGITDHGNCANWLDFYNAARKEGIKPALGVEAYIKGPEGRYNHLILLAKNYDGFKDISRFVTEANKHIEKMRSGKEIPVATEDMLDLVSTGNVICTSACIAGPVADPLMEHTRQLRETAKIDRQIERQKMPDYYDEAKAESDRINSRVKELAGFIKSKKAEAKTTKLKSLEKQLYNTNWDGPEEKKNALNREYAEEKSRIDRANGELTALEQERDRLKERLKEKYKDTGLSVKEIVSKGQTREKRIKELNDQKKEIAGTGADMTAAKEAAKVIAQRYKDRFGSDFYMEIQYHGIPAEKEVYPAEAEIAGELGISLVAANDSHVPTKDDVDTRTDIQNANYITTLKEYRSKQQGDDELYIKTGAELAEALLKVFTPEQVLEAMRNTEAIEKQIDIEIPEHQKHYPSFPDAKNLLRQRCEKGIKERYPDGFPDEKLYRDRLEYELSTIDKMGFNDYFCEVFDFIDFAKAHSDNSIEIGPARGSAAGSLVAYLCGITELDDPIKMGLMFERFLNPERVSMPDIDTDFSKHARDITVEYVKNKYGRDSVANIMTKARMGEKMAIDYAGKLYGLQTTGDKRKYMSLNDRIKSALDDAKVESLNTPEADTVIEEKFGSDPAALAIVKKARPLEGLTTSFGTHAAGVIIVGNGEKVGDLIPLISITDRNGNQGYAIQADMVQAEAQLGFIKMDFLGLKNLNVISRAMQLITRDTGTRLDPYKLPIEKEVIEDIFQKTDTNFVFQFESDGMKKMLSQLKPKSFGDLVLAVAVYRPGPMDFIPSIINSKNTGEPSDIVKKIPILKDALAETYGYPVYQEQVMKIMTECAGFTLGEADNVRRAMSKKHVEDLEAARPKFIKGSLEKNGISEEDSNWLFDKLMPFAKYGFNKAHAASYSMVSYMTAYLKEHYFKEYMCAVMTEQGDKVSQLLEDCRKHGVKVDLPDINMSGVDFEPGERDIMFGLSNIKQVKNAAAKIVEERKKNGKYLSVPDLIKRVNPDSGVIEALARSGALESICHDRKKALDYAKRYKESYSEVLKKETSLEKAQEKYNEEKSKPAPDEKKLKRLELSMDKAESDLNIARDEADCLMPSRRIHSKAKDDLAGEYEYLGAWISGSPLDDYSLKGYEKASCEPGYHKIAGVVTNFRIYHTKKDNREMCGFTLVDKDSTPIRCTVFPRQYEHVKDMIKDDAVIAVNGEVIEKAGKEEGDDPQKEMHIDDVSPLREKEEVILLTTYDQEELYEKVYPTLNKCRDDSKGLKCAIFEEQTQEMIGWSQKVNRNITEEWEHSKIIKMEPDGTAYVGGQEIDVGVTLMQERGNKEYTAGSEDGYNPYDRDNAVGELPSDGMDIPDAYDIR